MKKISLKGITEILSEKELKNVLGGSGTLECSGTIACSGTCSDPVKRCVMDANNRCGCWGRINF